MKCSPLLVVAILSFLALQPSVLAFPVEIVFSQTEIATCAEPITPQDVKITVQNLGSDTDSYALSLDLPEGWNGQIKQTIILASGEQKEVNPFLVSSIPLGTVPGDYEITVTAKSLSNSQDVSAATLKIKILPCFQVQLSAADFYAEICQESAATVTKQIQIKNLGKFTDTFKLNASVPWITFSENSLTLAPQETKSVAVTAAKPAGLVGVQDILLTATSASYPGSDTETFKLNIIDCHAALLTIEPVNSKICFGQSAELSLVVKNTGTETDTFTLVAPSWITLESTQVTLTPGEFQNISVTAAPLETGPVSVEISATSQTEGETFAGTGTIDVSDCRDVSLNAGPSEIAVCPAQEVEFSGSVQNTGGVTDTYTISTTLGSLSVAQTTLTPNETENFSLTIDTTDVSPGTHAVSIQAASQGAKDSMTLKFVVKTPTECALISGGTKTVYVMPGKAVVVELGIKNPGETEEEFLLDISAPSWITIAPQKLTLPAGGTDMAFVYVSPSLTEALGTVIPVSVHVTAGNAETSIPLTVIVGEDPSGLNASYGGVTGQLIAGPAWKTAAIAVITLLIIIVLAARFYLLIRK